MGRKRTLSLRITTSAQKTPASNVQKSSDAINVLHEWYLDQHSQQSLQNLTKSDLIDICEKRGLSCEGTKQTLIEAILHWRSHALPPGQLDLISKLPRDFISLPNLAEMSLNSPEESPTKKQKRILFSVPQENSQDELEEQQRPNTEAVKNQMVEFKTARSQSQRRKKSKDSGVYVSSSQELSGDIPYKELIFKREIGQGGFKKVYRGIYREQQVAIGVIINAHKMEEAEWKDLENELKVLKQLRHDNIVQFIGISKLFETNGQLKEFCMLTEFCARGDLADYMARTPNPTNFKEKVSLMYDIAFGVSYLHARNPAIIHRDLKSMNIFITDDNRAKIGDFGLSKILGSDQKKKWRRWQGSGVHSVVGTINWQSPEMWCEEPNYNEKVDVYSCGLIFWEILQWQPDKYPFCDLNDFQIYEKVGKQHLRPSLDPFRKKSNLNITNLIDEMWQSDPEKRPNMLSVLSVLQEELK